MAGGQPPSADRRRVRPQRRWWRRQRRQGEGDRSVGPGRRKTFANFVGNAQSGGHSSVPVRDNAIYQLSRALRVDEHEFPAEMTDTTRRFFRSPASPAGTRSARPWSPLRRTPRLEGGSVVNTDRFHLTCARRAWPRCSTAAMRPTRCRSAPGQRQLPDLPWPFNRGHPRELARGSAIRCDRRGAAACAPVTARPAARRAHPRPVQSSPRVLAGDPGHSVDGQRLYRCNVPGAVGIPTYGIPGMWSDPDSSGVHGLNERIDALR